MEPQINLSNIPKHLAIIMDGNGRWATKMGARRIFGHQNANRSVRETVEGSIELGIKYLTLFAFSTENWRRPKQEVDALMELLAKTLRNDTLNLLENNVRLRTIGDISVLPAGCLRQLEETVVKTQNNDGLILTLALSYSGKWDLLNAMQKVFAEKKSNNDPNFSVTAEDLEKHLDTFGIPDPELLIRTSGEMRISNFMLWQMAYTELYFTPTLWPDFRKDDLFKAIRSYQTRERRFGKTGKQTG